MKALLTTVLAGSVAAGCGAAAPDDVGRPLTRAQYQDAIRDVMSAAAPTDRLFIQLVARELPREECTRKAREFHAGLEQIVADVENLSPPEDVAEFQEQFLDAARESVDEIGDAAERVEMGDLSCGEDLNAAIYGLPSTERAERALARIESAGYVIFGE